MIIRCCKCKATKETLEIDRTFYFNFINKEYYCSFCAKVNLSYSERIAHVCRV